MKKLIIERFGKLPKLVTSDIQRPKSSEYLVKMKYAPINPADLGFLFGRYGITRDLPTGLGFQGSGVIQNSDNQAMIGKRVSVIVPSVFKDGTYTTHLIIPKQSVAVWPNESDFKQIACSMINPLTVLGFKRIVEKQGFKNILLSASNSQLSRMIIKHLSKTTQIPIYGIVRNQAQIKELKQLGAHNIFLEDQLNEQIPKLKNVVFFDPVGGDFTGKVFKLLSNNSKIVVFGNLAKQTDIKIAGNDLFFKNKSIQGFWLNTLLDAIEENEFEKMKREVVNNGENFKVDIAKEYSLDDFEVAIREALKTGNNGKILFSM